MCAVGAGRGRHAVGRIRSGPSLARVELEVGSSALDPRDDDRTIQSGIADLDDVDGDAFFQLFRGDSALGGT